MLGLRVTWSGVVPEVPDDAQVWRDWSGVPRAYGYTREDQHWIRLPDVASYRFSASSREVEAVAPASASQHEVEDAYRRHVLPFVLHALGRELLHASAVATPRGAVAFCGSSGAGKSTLAYELSLRGNPQLADDALLFESAEGAVHAIPIPFTVRVSGETIATNGSAPQAASVPMAAAFALERTDELGPGREEVIPLPGASAFPLLLYHAHCFSFRDERRIRLMADRYLELAARIRAFRLRYRPDLDRLPQLLDTVERALG
jgi:hypothetical protein